jgi:hypothetical protein
MPMLDLGHRNANTARSLVSHHAQYFKGFQKPSGFLERLLQKLIGAVHRSANVTIKAPTAREAAGDKAFCKYKKFTPACPELLTVPEALIRIQTKASSIQKQATYA